MFRIKWRVPLIRSRYGIVNWWTTGLSTFPDMAAAERQRDIWKRLFPANDYIIE